MKVSLPSVILVVTPLMFAAFFGGRESLAIDFARKKHLESTDRRMVEEEAGKREKIALTAANHARATITANSVEQAGQAKVRAAKSKYEKKFAEEKQIQDAADSRLELELKELSSNLKLELVEIELAQETGKLSKADAIRQEFSAKRRQQEERFRLENAATEARRKSLQRQAEASGEMAKAHRDSADELERALSGMLTSTEAEAVHAALKASDARLRALGVEPDPLDGSIMSSLEVLSKNTRDAEVTGADHRDSPLKSGM